MNEIYYGELRRKVKQHAREIRELNPEYQSTEWYVLKYLHRIEHNLGPEPSQARIENSMRGFIRFYVDQVKTDSRLGQRCLLIYEEYRRARSMRTTG